MISSALDLVTKRMSKSAVTRPVSFENKRASENLDSSDVEVEPLDYEEDAVEMPREQRQENCLEVEKKTMTSTFCGSTHEVTSAVIAEDTLSACSMCFHCRRKSETDNADFYDSSLTSFDMHTESSSSKRKLPTVRSFVMCLSLVQLFQVMGSG